MTAQTWSKEALVALRLVRQELVVIWSKKALVAVEKDRLERVVVR